MAETIEAIINLIIIGIMLYVGISMWRADRQIRTQIKKIKGDN